MPLQAPQPIFRCTSRHCSAGSPLIRVNVHQLYNVTICCSLLSTSSTTWGTATAMPSSSCDPTSPLVERPTRVDLPRKVHMVCGPWAYTCIPTEGTVYGKCYSAHLVPLIRRVDKAVVQARFNLHRSLRALSIAQHIFHVQLHVYTKCVRQGWTGIRIRLWQFSPGLAHHRTDDRQGGWRDRNTPPPVTTNYFFNYYFLL